MKNILVPIDFSIYSLSAAKSAAVIASKSGAKITFLHITDMPVGFEKQSVAQQQRYPELEERLMKAKMKIDKFSQLPVFANCLVRTTVIGGVAFEQIIIFSERNKIDLIVMGVHGGGESYGKFIGSTAQRVMRSALCPVLGIKKNYNIGGIKKILFASDFDEDVRLAVEKVKELASDLKANVDLAFINTPSNFLDDLTMEGRMKKFIVGERRIKLQTVIHNSNHREEGIIQCAKRRNANMIAMVTHLRTHKVGYLIGITESVLFQSKLPVLSIIINPAKS